MSYDGYYYQTNKVRHLIDELLGMKIVDIAERIQSVEDDLETRTEELKEANDRIAELEAEQAA